MSALRHPISPSYALRYNTEQESDTFDEFMTDTLVLYKADGRTFPGIRASVSPKQILIPDVRLPIEVGDKLNALTGIRGANNRAAAARIVRAIESILADDAKSKEGYALGHKDCAENKLKKAKREHTALRTRQLRRV